MHICYVTETYPPEVNGVALTVERTVEYLRGQRHAVLLMRPRQPGEAARDDEDEWRSAGLPIPMYPDLRLGLATTATLRRRLMRARPSLVHVATPGPLGRAAVLAAGSLGIPVTMDFRTNFHSYSRYYRCGWLEPAVRHYLRTLHNRAACSFVPTREMQALLVADGFERVAAVGRGVDPVRFAPGRRSEALRASWGVTDPRDTVLLHVGRLAAEKNIGLALQAYDALRAWQPETKLVLVGDGPLRKRLQARCPTAHFTGMLRGDTLAEHCASADLMLVPSMSETFGNVTLEGMACGLGVIAFDLAAAGEYIVHRRNGWLVPPADASAYVNTVVAAGLAPTSELSLLRRRARAAALQANWDAALAQFGRELARHALGAEREQARDVALA